MTKLNFGCGLRFVKGWTNIDFHSEHQEVRRVNLLKPWPYPNHHFDVAYSSHTLEHFSLPVAETLLKECLRVMKPGGILRVVVPDLENTCREYLRVLQDVDSSDLARQQYDWVILELLDQLTRSVPSGLMGPYLRQLEASGDQKMIQYVISRTDTNPWHQPAVSTMDKLKKVTLNKLLSKALYTYVGVLKKLLPPSLRETIQDSTRIGEKHRWMYDHHNLRLLLTRCGFSAVTRRTATQSRIPDFEKDFLDVNPDGSVYKPPSLYCEAQKPG